MKYFKTGLFSFIDELEMNNNKEWFEANKVRHELEVRQPALRFIEDLGSRSANISPHGSV
jgi:uncharacterized protein (DUF2461 family)